MKLLIGRLMAAATIALAILALGAASRAHADERWTVLDLGGLKKESHCIEAAAEAFRSFAFRFGLAAIRHRGWTVHGDDLGRRGLDAVITCNHGINRGARATLVVYSPNGALTALPLAESLEIEFQAARKRITREWIEEVKTRLNLS